MPQSQKDWQGKSVAIEWPERGLAFDQVSIRNPQGNDWDVYVYSTR
jgi:hypothetical protein